MKNTLVPKEILSKINSSKYSLVLAHQNPDGDSLGSMLALGKILEQKGHVVDYLVPDFFPEAYKFLPNAEQIKLPSDKSLKNKYDIAFSLDCGSVKRLGDSLKFWNTAATTINIDHHISNEQFGNLNWIEADAVSTGQVVFSLAKGLSVNITPDLATLFYVTLLTDTGCFSNSNTTAESLSWGADLISLGANHLEVYKKAFLEKSFKTLKVFSHGLNNLTILENGNIAVAYVDGKTMKSLSATPEDTEDIADYMKRLKDVKVCVFLREDNEKETKVSLRSNNDFDVSKVAISMGGGGHKRAAGVNMKLPLDKAKEIILEKVVNELKNTVLS